MEKHQHWQLSFSFFFAKKVNEGSDNSERGSPLYKLFGAGWGQKGVGGFFLKSDHTVACSLGANGEKV